MLYGCVTWSPRACHCDTLRRIPQVLDSLHRLAKAQSRLLPDFLSGHAYQDGKWEHRGDFTQEADLVYEICGAHGGYETAEVRDVRRIGGGRGLCGGPEKRVDGVFPERPQSFRHQRRPVSGRLQPGTRENGAEWRNKGRNISWLDGSLQRKPGLDYGMQSYART